MTIARPSLLGRPLQGVFAALIAATGAAVLPTPASAQPETAAATAARPGTTTFHFDDIPVRSALQLLAEEGNFNLVVSDAVTGNISLHLEDVTWQQVLDLVLKLKGLEQHVDGDSRSVTPARD